MLQAQFGSRRAGFVNNVSFYHLHPYSEANAWQTNNKTNVECGDICIITALFRHVQAWIPDRKVSWHCVPLYVDRSDTLKSAFFRRPHLRNTLKDIIKEYVIQYKYAYIWKVRRKFSSEQSSSFYLQFPASSPFPLIFWILFNWI